VLNSFNFNDELGNVSDNELDIEPMDKNELMKFYEILQSIAEMYKEFVEQIPEFATIINGMAVTTAQRVIAGEDIDLNDILNINDPMAKELMERDKEKFKEHIYMGAMFTMVGVWMGQKLRNDGFEG
jgi:hypothetical protein